MSTRTQVEINGQRVYSPRFDDIYFNPESGPEESSYVFLAGNDLPARWQGRPGFCIAETGFGTGLNFLLTLQAWLNDPARSTTLQYISIEAYPLRAPQLAKIHAAWPHLAELSAQLVEQYPAVAQGDHTLLFAAGKARLQLIFEPAQQALETYQMRADSWYLDGFAPSRNPSMWKKAVLEGIAARSRKGARLATFTAAGEVRRTLLAAGFEVNKRKGFGRKREMLCARKLTPPEGGGTIRHAPWFALPDSAGTLRKVTVIGSGIAGAQAAWHLAQRGIEVIVFDQNRHIAKGASGNRAGILAPRLTASASAGEAFYLSACAYQFRQLGLLQQQGHAIDFSPCGLLQLAHNRTTEQRLARIAGREEFTGLLEHLSPEQVSQRLGERSVYSGLLIHQAGALSPASLCKALLDQPNIELRLGTSLQHIDHHGCRPLLTLSTQESLAVDAVVIANGERAAEFADSIEITPVRGQTSSALVSLGSPSQPALDHAGYLVSVPGESSRVIFGASFIREDRATELREDETQANLATLRSCLPTLASRLSGIESSHAGIRATTRDRWPIVGPLPEAGFYVREYADLRQGQQYKIYPQAEYKPGIYLLSGLGSRGLASAGYCANLLTQMMAGEMPSAPRGTLEALHPARFVIRQLKKGTSMP